LIVIKANVFDGHLDKGIKTEEAQKSAVPPVPSLILPVNVERRRVTTLLDQSSEGGIPSTPKPIMAADQRRNPVVKGKTCGCQIGDECIKMK
jgi:hypothetical protein